MRFYITEEWVDWRIAFYRNPTTQDMLDDLPDEMQDWLKEYCPDVKIFAEYKIVGHAKDAARGLYTGRMIEGIYNLFYIEIEDMALATLFKLTFS